MGQILESRYFNLFRSIAYYDAPVCKLPLYERNWREINTG